MKIEKYVVGMIGTNCYLVINEETKDTVMVDPGSYPAKLAEGCTSDACTF